MHFLLDNNTSYESLWDCKYSLIIKIFSSILYFLHPSEWIYIQSFVAFTVKSMIKYTMYTWLFKKKKLYILRVIAILRLKHKYREIPTGIMRQSWGLFWIQNMSLLMMFLSGLFCYRRYYTMFKHSWIKLVLDLQWSYINHIFITK